MQATDEVQALQISLPDILCYTLHYFPDKVTHQQQPTQIQAEMHQKNPST